MIALLWCLLGLVLLSASAAWFWRIPVYTNGIGEVSSMPGQQQIVILLSADQLHTLHAGLPVQVSLGQNGPSWQERIAEVEPSVMNASQIESRLGVTAPPSTPPSAVVIVHPDARLSAHISVGGFVQARIQVQTRRVISLLPGLAMLGGE